jgi:hypothetical protein
MNCVLSKVKYKWWDVQSKLGTVKHKWVRSYAYLKFVWTTGDFDWDYGFLEELIKMKLKWMHDYHATHNLSVAHNRITRQLWYALRLIELIEIAEHDYSDLDNYVRRREDLVDRLFKHVRNYYRGWWE